MDVLIWGRKSRNKIDIQLKCTSLDSHSIIEDKGDYYSYKLESKDKYEAGEKYLFIILVLPKDIKTTEIVNFNKIDYDSVIMNAKGYFYEYSTQKQAIRIPKSNLLCKDLLINLIQASEDKSTLIKDL